MGYQQMEHLHTVGTVWELLNAVYLWRQFGYGGPLCWPPKFLDLNPVDYFYGEI